MQQGKTHGYQSRVRVGRGSDKNGRFKHFGSSSSEKTPKHAKRANSDRPTDPHIGSEIRVARD